MVSCSVCQGGRSVFFLAVLCAVSESWVSVSVWGMFNLYVIQNNHLHLIWLSTREFLGFAEEKSFIFVYVLYTKD